MTTAAEVLARCAELDTHSADPAMLVRTYLTPEHAQANAAVAGWMQAAGMDTWVDAAGNQWGRVRPREAGLPALILGSHIDTVIDAGSYDGPLGVVMAIAVVDRLRRRGVALPFTLEVVAFNDEEGTRFGSALLGSYAVAGLWDDAWWELRDADGVGLAEAFRAFGLDPARVREAARPTDDVVGYLEAHIEQGPLLEQRDVSLGYVTTIAGARRFTLSVLGEARHAGGTPYDRRRDALVGASHAIALIERLARHSSTDPAEDDGGFIATVGRIEVHPGAVNVVPGRADFSLDLRAGTDARRDAAWEQIGREIAALCAERDLGFEVVERYSADAAVCAPWLRDAVAAGIAATGQSDVPGLWSRAGHDAMAMARVTDIGMLFLRCHDGISHHPAEDVREVDVAAGLDALEATVLAVAEAVRS